MELLHDKNDLKKILTLSFPAIVQEALNTVVTYVDTAMVGALGAASSAAVGLTSSVGWFVSNFAVAFGVGVLAICAQSDGANNKEKMQKAGQQAIFMTIGVGILLTIGCIIISPYLPIWLNGDPSIRNEASTYFFIISLPMLFRTSVVIFSAALRGVSDMKTPMIINLWMNMINIILNYLLIYDTHQISLISIPGANLGVKGAAIATAISYVVGGVLMFRQYYKNTSFQFYQTGFHFDKNIFKECLTISITVMMERSVICLGHVTFSSLIAKLGVVQLAAHTIAIQAEQAFYVPGYGFQSAAATLVGNAVGQKDEDKVKKTTYLICAITSGLMLIAGLILFFNASLLMGIFTPDLKVIEIGSHVLRIVSISEPIYGILVILEGTFNGMGDTKAPFIFSLITMWGVRIFGSWMIINVFHLGLEIVWIMMVCDNVSRCILLGQRFFRGKWKYLLEREAV